MPDGFEGKPANVQTGSMSAEREVTAPSSTACSTADPGGVTARRSSFAV